MDKTIVKAFSLLEVLAESRTPLGVTELADASELGKSNVHRLLQTLSSLGYVRQDESSLYSATTRLWEVGSKVIAGLSVRELARPAMQSLSELTRETIHLSQLDGGDVLYIDKIESSEPVRAYTQLGGRAPAHCTATGKVMLAFADPDHLNAVLAELVAHTDATITDPDRFRAEVDTIRRRGFSVNHGEWRADVMGLAAPVVDQQGEVVAAIGLSAPAARLDIDALEAFAPDLLKQARGVSRALGVSDETWHAIGER